MPTQYTNLYDITLLQQDIMHLIDEWCHLEKTPIPQSKILNEMIEKGEKSGTVVNALNGLLKLGYIRRAVGSYFNTKKLHSDNNKTYYVMLRRL